ncbi:uncharacterized protein AB675_10411 [Cyphellophora attinorum]|uniref:Amino acid transporter transmembrane domain-containing protein n=1 Tax=Cyphellophora attinorum TaxID=1664694 RepID=A0A0N1NYM9_9EURO|nr:uncharacterized protein AB675_10411 [Phialophora attinorum]KPI35986.1 hypothetical protein AB675_10411 [Phialophora attinorum]
MAYFQIRASSGIGLATVELFLSKGAIVYGADLQPPKTSITTDRFTFVPLDVTSWTDLCALFQDVYSAHKRIDVLHANAGMYSKANFVGVLQQLPDGSLSEPSKLTFHVNLHALANQVALASHYMISQQIPAGGSIILTASSTSYQWFDAPDYVPLSVEQFNELGVVSQPPEAVARSVALFATDEGRNGQCIYSRGGEYVEMESPMRRVMLKQFRYEGWAEEDEREKVIDIIFVKSEQSVGQAIKTWYRALTASPAAAAVPNAPAPTLLASSAPWSGNDTAVASASNGQPQTHHIDTEWRRASRALCTAGWATIFYLITTDVIGWAQTPFVFASVGYNTAIGIFVLFGLAAMASALMIRRTFVGLDSSRYPMVSFGDPFFRLFGPKTHSFISHAQNFQIFCAVAVNIQLICQLMSQLNGGRLCCIVIGIICTIIGICSCVLRSLAHVGIFAMFCVWTNVANFIMILVFAAKFGPRPEYALQTTLLKNALPVKTFWGVPPAQYQQQSTDLFVAQFNGINSIVYAYSGALASVAFLSEMRHPMDFWKAALLAQVLIIVLYLVFGTVVYTFFGQYTVGSTTQVVSPHSVQVASMVLALLTSFIAVFMYFNIGMNMVYVNFAQPMCNLPPLHTQKGYMWC